MLPWLFWALPLIFSFCKNSVFLGVHYLLNAHILSLAIQSTPLAFAGGCSGVCDGESQRSSAEVL